MKDLLFLGRRETHPADRSDGFFEGEQGKVGAVDELADADLADDPPDLAGKRRVPTHYGSYGRNVEPDIVLIPRISFPGLDREQLLKVNETHVGENELCTGMIDRQHHELTQFIGIFGTIAVKEQGQMQVPRLFRKRRDLWRCDIEMLCRRVQFQDIYSF